MVERLLRAVRHAGLRPEGVDLSAFALIRSLYQRAATEPDTERVLYLNIGGLTNMAIAEGTVCRFTRVVGGGLEAMASEIAERRGIPLVEARALLAAYDISRAQPAAAVLAPPVTPPAPVAEVSAAAPAEAEDEEPLVDFHAGFGTPPETELVAAPPAPEPVETWALAQDPSGESARSASQSDVAPAAGGEIERSQVTSARVAGAPDPEVRLVLENGIREIVGEVRNSLDFHRSQDGGGEVTSVVLSGPALEMSGFAEALEADLGLAVRRQSVRGVDGSVFASVSADRLAIAAGLATEQAPA
jgi:Tfp pilus assembly PilM family ATPase